MRSEELQPFVEKLTLAIRGLFSDYSSLRRGVFLGKNIIRDRQLRNKIVKLCLPQGLCDLYIHVSYNLIPPIIDFFP